MKNKVLNEIKDFAVKKLGGTYGYCGIAESDDYVLLNSDDRQGNDIKITIAARVIDLTVD